MRSPFPGMDPYLEAHWHGVHASFCVYARDALQPQITPALFAEIDERLVIEYHGRRERDVRPDVSIIEEEPWQTSGGGLAMLEVAEPLVLLDDDPMTESFIRIVEAAEGRLVTVIEFLSLTNKLPGDGQTKYLQKRNEYYETGVNLVEVDLLRQGERIVTARHRIPPSHRTTYQVCVRRAYNWRTEIYAVPLRRALPTIGVPLRKGDADAHLNLQALIEQIYRNGAYQRRIDYNQPPDPPLSDADAVWAAELLPDAPNA